MNLNRSCCSSTLARCFTMVSPIFCNSMQLLTHCNFLWTARQEKNQEQPGTPTTRMVRSRFWLYLLVIRAPSQSCISRDLSILSVAWTWNFGFTVPSPLDVTDVTNATVAKGIRPSSTSLSLGSVPAILVTLVVEHEWSEVCFKASKGPSTRSTKHALFVWVLAMLYTCYSQQSVQSDFVARLALPSGESAAILKTSSSCCMESDWPFRRPSCSYRLQANLGWPICE